MSINPFIVSILLLLGSPALAHGDRGYQDKPFDEVKAMKLVYLRRMTACVEKAKSLEEMKGCRPKRRPMVGKPGA